MPFVSPKDLADIVFAVEQDYDFIAASFTRTAEDIMEIRKILQEHGGEKIHIIAKLENKQGVKNCEDILRVADGIMIARGDMGVEIPLEEVPVIQKELIRKAMHMGKPVITATQMLDSMMKNPRPTRAETSDVANAIYQGTSAIMLSGETAAGAYPIEAVQTMAKIAERTDQCYLSCDLYDSSRSESSSYRGSIQIWPYRVQNRKISAGMSDHWLYHR